MNFRMPPNPALQAEINQRYAAVVVRQRNDALNEVAMLTVQRDSESAAREAAFQALHDRIVSGRISEDEVPALMSSIPGFGSWRTAKLRAERAADAQPAAE